MLSYTFSGFLCFLDAGFGYGHNKEGMLDNECPEGEFSVYGCLLECYKYKITHDNSTNAVNYLRQPRQCCCELNTVKNYDENNKNFFHYRLYPYRMEL